MKSYLGISILNRNLFLKGIILCCCCFQLTMGLSQHKLRLKKNGRSKTYQVGDQVSLMMNATAEYEHYGTIDSITSNSILLRDGAKSYQYDTLAAKKLSKKQWKNGWRIVSRYFDDIAPMMVIRKPNQYELFNVPFKDIKAIQSYRGSKTHDRAALLIIELGILTAYSSPFTGISKTGYNFKAFYTTLSIGAVLITSPFLWLYIKKAPPRYLCEWTLTVI